jgi:hypothetical protein
MVVNPVQQGIKAAVPFERVEREGFDDAFYTDDV